MAVAEIAEEFEEAFGCGVIVGLGSEGGGHEEAKGGVDVEFAVLLGHGEVDGGFAGDLNAVGTEVTGEFVGHVEGRLGKGGTEMGVGGTEWNDTSADARVLIGRAKEGDIENGVAGTGYDLVGNGDVGVGAGDDGGVANAASGTEVDVDRVFVVVNATGTAARAVADVVPTPRGVNHVAFEDAGVGIDVAVNASDAFFADSVGETNEGGIGMWKTIRAEKGVA